MVIRMLKTGTVLLILSLGISAGYGQDYHPKNLLRFANHLYKTGDFVRAAAEYERFLYLSPEYHAPDSVSLTIALAHQQRDRFDLALNQFRDLLKTYPRSEIVSLARYGIPRNLHSMARWGEILGMADDPPSGYADSFWLMKSSAAFHTGEFDHAWKYLELAAEVHDKSRFTDLLEKAENTNAVSPWLAGMSSALIPGSGRLLYGRTGDGVYSFVTIAVTGGIACLGYRSQRNITAVVATIATAAFYGGNIYGSYVGAKHHNRQADKKMQGEYFRYTEQELFSIEATWSLPGLR